MKEFVEWLARSLVEQEEAVRVTEAPVERGILLELSVAQEDMGKIIGRQGRTIHAMRTVLAAACARLPTRYFLEIRE